MPEGKAKLYPCLNSKAVVLRKLSMHDKDIEMYGEASKLESNPILHFNKGNALLTSERYDLAIKAFEKTYELDNTNINALIIKAECVRLLNDYDKSIETIDIVLSLQPNNITALKIKSLLLVDKKENKDDVISILYKVLSLSANEDTDIHVLYLLEELGEFEKGISFYEKGIITHKSNIKIKVIVSSFLIKERQYFKAIYVCKEILKDYPNEPVAYYNMAYAFSATGNSREAMSMLLEAIKIDRFLLQLVKDEPYLIDIINREEFRNKVNDLIKE